MNLTFINKCCYYLLVAFILSACGKIHFIEFEPIYVHAHKAGAKVYHASYTQEIDIIHTELDVSFNWDSAFVYGEARIEAQPYFYATDSVVLDAKGFKIQQIKQQIHEQWQAASYTYVDNKITIRLNKTYRAKEPFVIKINYTAAPRKLKVGSDIFSSDDRGLYFIQTKGKKQIWTQGETENNSCWFPTIENPGEKMTHQFNIRVEEKYKTLSNGLLKESIKHTDGTRTDSWLMQQPHAVYLSMLAVGEFEIIEDKWNDIPLRYYTERAYAATAKKVFGNTPAMLDFFSKQLNYPYPWPKYDQIVVRNFVSGAMENTTASVFYNGLNLTAAQHEDYNQDDIIAHELYHHWFGNLVTCESWSNLPLNESFATYGEYLWREFKNGKEDADEHLYQMAQTYFGYAKNRDANVVRFNYADKEHMFDAISYQKGAIILHNLRTLVGDEAFFASLNLYLTQNAYKAVEIHHLRLAFEEVTGKDLNWYFKQWFLAKGYPELKIMKNYDAQNQQLIIDIEQLQDTTSVPVYQLPITVKTVSKGKANYHDILVSDVNQRFIIPVSAVPDVVKFDIHNNLLIKKLEDKSEGDYENQFLYADNYLDKLEAISYFEIRKTAIPAVNIFQKALSDTSWSIILKGLENYKLYTQDFKNQNLKRVKDLAVNHPKSIVRAEAVKVLKRHYSKAAYKEIVPKIKEDVSALVHKALH
ncbi:M1 family metallopeptidase [Pedobacter puniceum]|uniref:Aminopeptidase N n=1 Tax=Pedobacter puniceum TaxID=2666136 RepID=A0A7K0FNA3_9SPHI|nr:M1 family metallopeptidase [Pedobacter puniceum]MRX47403.1 M1 family peptidase [Pedobacter puniceum]